MKNATRIPSQQITVSSPSGDPIDVEKENLPMDKQGIKLDAKEVKITINLATADGGKPPMVTKLNITGVKTASVAYYPTEEESEEPLPFYQNNTGPQDIPTDGFTRSPVGVARLVITVYAPSTDGTDKEAIEPYTVNVGIHVCTQYEGNKFKLHVHLVIVTMTVNQFQWSRNLHEIFNTK